MAASPKETLCICERTQQLITFEAVGDLTLGEPPMGSDLGPELAVRDVDFPDISIATGKDSTGKTAGESLQLHNPLKLGQQ